MADSAGAPLLQNERYKVCRIVCERRNGWTLRTFCRGAYSAVCTQTWRMGHQANTCVSPQVDWTEKVIRETQCCVDATVQTRGKSQVPEADNATRAFCLKHCEDVLDKEREWSAKDLWDVCRHHMS